MLKLLTSQFSKTERRRTCVKPSHEFRCPFVLKKLTLCHIPKITMFKGMKCTLLFALLLGFTTSFAQITITKANFPVAGDTLRIGVDNLPANISIGPGGADLRWDFTALQSPFTRQIAVRPATAGERMFDFPEATLMTPLANESEVYYRTTSSVYQRIGIFGEDPFGLNIKALTRYAPPLTELQVPLDYRDARSGRYNFFYAFSADDLPRAVLDQLPITPDSIRVRVAAKQEAVVDAWGKMTIPGGIYNVLREKRTEIRELRVDAKLGFLPWSDITGLIPNSNLVGQDTIVTYHYFSNEAKEPIAVVTMDAAAQKPIRIEYKANDILSNVQNISSLKPGVYAFPNPAIVNVRFEFSNLPPGNYKLAIFNILGVEVWSEHYFINGQRIEKVDISSLRKGTYLYSLQNERGKTISTKRLVVVRP